MRCLIRSPVRGTGIELYNNSVTLRMLSFYRMADCRSDAERLLVDHYLNGGSTTYVETKPFIRGGSRFTDVLARIGRAALPIAKKAGKYLGKNAINMLANTSSDILSGKNVGQAFKDNASATAENIRFDLAQKVNNKRRKSRQPLRKKRVRGGNLW